MDASPLETPPLYENGCPDAGFLAPRSLRLLLAVVMGLVNACGWPRDGCGQVQDSYEGPGVTWKLSDHDCAPRMLQHERTFTQAHSGQTSELVAFDAGTGTYVHLVSPLPATGIIDELKIGVWVKANRPGLQLSARAVLPRSKDPRSGTTLTTLIRGTTYDEAEKWQELTIELPLAKLNRQVPMLRSQFGSDVSPREAYVDMLVLNAYGGAGRTELWLDDLQVSGQVLVAGNRPKNEGHATASQPLAPLGTSKSQSAPQLQGSVLTVAGNPLLVRAIDHNGEPFAWLKSIGFNTVHLATPATPEQLREAEECGMWLVAPPPTNQSPLEYGTGLEQVLAWDLGRHLSTPEVDSTRHLAQQLRSLPDEAKRAIICMPCEASWQYSRIVDLTVFEPPGPNSSLPLASYGPWYLQRTRLLRLDSHFWASIRTQVSPVVAQQQSVMGNPTGDRISLEPEQIRLLTYHALASGARGLLFRSFTRLDQHDRMTDLRAKTLQRINRELGIVEPWAATGEHTDEIVTGDASVRVSVLRTNRSRLLIIIRQAADQQYVVGPVAEQAVSFDIPNIPETDEVYQVGEDGLRRITPGRNTGVHITLDKPRLITTVVVTQDPLVVNFLAGQTADLRRYQDQLVGDIAAQMYSAVVETHQQLLVNIPASGLSSVTVESQSLDQARNELQQFQGLIEGGGHERAYEFLQRGRQQLALTRYQNWKLASSVFPSPVSSPLCVGFFTLPQHYALGQTLRGANWGPNSLAGGDFENLSVIQSSGWKNTSNNAPELGTSVELSLQAPHAGRSALRLRCWPLNTAQSPVVIESPPILITSAPVPVRRGQLVRIHGWARVPQPIQGTLDGLLIYDSIAGMELAERIQTTTDWREFSLYRAATRDGTLTVTAALSGLGEAWLDDITVNAISMSGLQAQRSTPTDSLPRR